MKEHTTPVGRLLAVSTLFLTFFVTPAFVYAEDVPTGSFVVRPAKVELAIAPGEEKTSILTLSNGTALPLSVTVSYEDIAPNAQTSATDEPIVLLGKNGGTYPLKDLFRTPERSVDILSGKEVQIPITVRVPKDAEAGGRYGSVVLTFAPVLQPGVTQSANVAIESRLATLFYVRVTGNAKEEGHLVAFGLFNNAKTSPTPSTENPLRFQVAFENTGAVHLNPYGRITLSPILGRSTEILVDPQAVLPLGTRMREVDVRDPLSIGYYTAHLELNRGYGDIVDESEVHFWIIPGTGGMVAIFLGLLGLVWLIRRSLALSRHSI